MGVNETCKKRCATNLEREKGMCGVWEGVGVVHSKVRSTTLLIGQWSLSLFFISNYPT